jgi:putative inorganic carbon (hco3(-)) transporter
VEPLSWIGLVAAAIAAGVALVADGRLRAVAMVAALVLAPAVVLGDVWTTERVVELRDSPAQAAALALCAAAGVAVAAWLLHRRPELLPVAALAVLPFRVPIPLGGERANLLIPLYLVIAGAAVALAMGAWRELPDSARKRDPVNRWLALSVRWLPWLLAGFIVLYAVQSAWSDDASKAIENVGFFFVPFAVLFSLLARARWTTATLRTILIVVVAEALVFSVVAFGQFAVGEVFWNPEVIASNEVHTYFRVNSLFWDPNILGRYLVLVVLALSAYMVWTTSRPRAWQTAAICVVLLAALVLTFSQSSLVALLAGMLALLAMRWGPRWALLAIAIAALAGGAMLAASGADLNSVRSLDIRSSGRASLVRGGAEMAADRPFAGHGSGSFETEFERRFPEDAEESGGAISHTEPVTVAAEQGLVGLIPYAALLAAVVGTLLTVPQRLTVARSALVACFAGLVVHSLAYAGLLIDPVTWAIVAAGFALARYSVED